MSAHTYRDWLITEPTTRRVHCDDGIWMLNEFEETDAEGLRLFLTADSEGDNNLYITVSDEAEMMQVLREMCYEGVPWPEARFGSWRRYWQTVEWAHWVFDLLGWEPTAEEAALLAALEEYGRRAPAHVLTKLELKVAA